MRELASPADESSGR